ncbi:hypothetical protein CEK71_03380 [Methylovulum psychrotolerans]|jgi:hypothetical protein|uniref:Uncharacterized protein n=1 Tax=Methylovulum psychrotolerans TaxID=1704499 RepID=A0A1Z4BV59_9GAMM|nr:hypothetical protein CEK71_03380 [Methylovulum psychrotolerans]MBT9097407.1 hypothetical protein [Methylovulum psychrotolerans]POZ50490.1 hypothetical protein AADEFJLK_03686 [Methylovulum psychrotolerans]
MNHPHPPDHPQLPGSCLLNELKQIISLRLVDSDRAAVQAIAARLFVRESDIYRFAINYLLNRFSCLFDDTYTGSDLLPAMLEIRAEINHTLGLKRHQLEKIINGNNINPDKYVAMCDIELLLMPQHLLRQRLLKLDENPRNQGDVETWLKDYLTDKYHLLAVEKKTVFDDFIVPRKKAPKLDT